MAEEREYEVDENDKIIEGKAEVVKEEEAEDDDQVEDSNTESEQESEDDDSGEDDNEREAIRARRREERHQKKEAARERDMQNRREREMLRKENEELASRLAVLERRAVGSEFAQLDQAIEQTGRATQYLKEQIKLATEAGDGATVAEAMDKLYQANRHVEHLNNVKRQAVNQSRQAEQRSPIDPQLRQHAEGWMEKHQWYDPSGTDPDSKIALTVDQSMAEEGWDPRHPEYWTELDARLNKYLPHRYARQESGTTRERTRSPVASSGRESGAPSSTGWKLSAERVAAMKETGAWDDPVKREAMIKSYRAYDKSAQK
jgi:hypothetical protein